MIHRRQSHICDFESYFTFDLLFYLLSSSSLVRETTASLPCHRLVSKISYVYFIAIILFVIGCSRHLRHLLLCSCAFLMKIEHGHAF
jgi:hypothetical protein